MKYYTELKIAKEVKPDNFKTVMEMSKCTRSHDFVMHNRFREAAKFSFFSDPATKRGGGWLKPGH